MRKWIDKLLGREKLKQRNDYLVAANNRLGKEILELRRITKPPKQSGKLKEIKKREDAIVVKMYQAHIQAQRQHLLVKKMRAFMPHEAFMELSREINEMTDEQIEAAQ